MIEKQPLFAHRVRKVPKQFSWLDHRLDLFIAYRRILLFTVMHGWISSEPGRHASWKEMIHTQPPVVGSLNL